MGFFSMPQRPKGVAAIGTARSRQAQIHWPLWPKLSNAVQDADSKLIIVNSLKPLKTVGHPAPMGNADI